MELAGLIVRALPRHLQRVESNLQSIPGLEIHHLDPNGRMIVTLEQDTHKALSNSIALLQGLEKVLAVSLVYQHSEELEDTNDSDVSPSPGQTPKHPTQPLTQHLTQKTD
jgi:nitrate reductase NapD